MSARRLTATLAALALGGLSLVALSRDRAGPPPPRAAGAPRALGLTVVAGRANVLDWSGDALSYRVERAARPGGPWTAVATTSSPPLRDRPPERRVYWYRVAPVAAGNATGPATAAVSSDNVDISGRIGPRGGVLRPTTGTVVLRVPRGSVPSGTLFTIRQLPAPPDPAVGGVLMTRAFDIGPSGTRFDPPAILTLRADSIGGAELPQDADVTARWWNSGGGTWDPLSRAVFDPRSSTVTARIPHLSLWAGVATTVPHGGYQSSTDYCGACHQTHMAPNGSRLFSAPTERETCYGCHGSSSPTDVRSEFGEAVIGASTRTSTHPVPAPAGGVQLTCSDCHTPHKPISEDTALLRVKQAGGTDLYSPPDSPIGDAFCYACHGPTSSLPAPFGDRSSFETSVHGTDAGVPLPSSGSGIRCLACHEPHGSDHSRLTTADQEDLCYTCHTAAGPSSPTGTTVPGSFTARANDYSTSDGNPIRLYHHPVAAVEQDGSTRTVECSSCHDVHLAERTDSATGSLIVDPANTSSPWIVSWSATAAPMTKGDIGGFCLQCHVGPSTTQPVAPGPNVPYSVRLVDDSGALDADGTPHDTFTAANWLNVSSHGPSLAGLACTACHDPHGSSNAYMLRESMVSPDGTTSTTITDFNGLRGDAATLQAFCQTCHATLPADTDHTGGALCTECHSHGSGRF